MQYHALNHTFLPELGMPKRGKVREIYENGNTLALIASDRISVFDRILDQPIPGKGQVLTQISRFWFEKTKDIIPNHLISLPDSNVMVVKKCSPIMVEVIVRAYLAGSMWRDYQKGKREKCGVAIPDGLKENDPLPCPIVTPTTKCHDGHDEDISKEALIAQKVVDKKLWDQIERAALKLFERGQEVAKERGMILVDTKYEFGLDENGNLLLIDEVHTPDSSRFWFKDEYDRKQVRFPDKELVREWVRDQGFLGYGIIPALPKEIVDKARKSYREVYTSITGLPLEEEDQAVPNRVLSNLKKANLIKGCFVPIISGSEKDQAHVDKILEVLRENDIPCQSIVASAHKNTQKVMELIEFYNASMEPIVCITVAGRSNALSGVFAANLKWPVIACPPFKDHSDYLVNVHSSLQMPSNVPVLTVIDPKNAGLATVKILKSMELSL